MQGPRLGPPVRGGILGIQPGFDRPPGCRRRTPRQRQPGSDIELESDEIETGDVLGHRVFDLQPGVHLEEEDPAGPVGEELHRPGAQVADRLGGRPRGVHERLAQARADPLDERRGRLLDDLLVAPLQGALPFDEGPDRAVGVGEDLDLDVSPGREIGLAEDRRVPEGRLGLAGGARHRVLEVGERGHDAHPPTSAPGGGLDEDRQVGVGDHRWIEPRQHRHPRLGHDGLGLDLAAHQSDRLRRRTDPEQPGVDDRTGELRALGEEAVAGVDRIRPGAQSSLDDGRDRQVGLRRGHPGQAYGPVRIGDMEGLGIGVGEHRDGGQPARPAGPEHPAGDLPAVGDENGGDRPGPGHGGSHRGLTSGTRRRRRSPRPTRNGRRTGRSRGPSGCRAGR